MSGAFFCSEIAIKLTRHKGFAAFGRAVDQEHGERFVLHEIDNVEKLALESRADRGEFLTVRIDERQDKILFHRAVLGVVVQGIGRNGNRLSVLRVLYHLPRRTGELVQQLLVVGVDVGSDDFHNISLSPRDADRTAICIRWNNADQVLTCRC